MMMSFIYTYTIWNNNTYFIPIFLLHSPTS